MRTWSGRICVQAHGVESLECNDFIDCTQQTADHEYENEYENEYDESPVTHWGANER